MTSPAPLEFLNLRQAIAPDLCQRIVAHAAAADVSTPWKIATIGILPTDLQRQFLELVNAIATRTVATWPYVHAQQADSATVIKTITGDDFFWHRDRHPRFPSRVLAVNVQLSKPGTYTGGVLHFHPGGPLHRLQGDVTVSLGTAWHHVSTVTTGTRFTAAVFYDGSTNANAPVHSCMSCPPSPW